MSTKEIELKSIISETPKHGDVEIKVTVGGGTYNVYIGTTHFNNYPNLKRAEYEADVVSMNPDLIYKYL